MSVPLGFFRSFKAYSDAKERVRCGKQQEAAAHIQYLVKLQPWFLSLRWKTCFRQNCCLGSCACSEEPALSAEHSDDDDDDDDDDDIFVVSKINSISHNSRN